MRSTIIYYLSTCLATLMLPSCNFNLPRDTPETLHYDNILIFSDLSNRITTTHPNDSLVIMQLMEFFVKDCVKPGAKVNDRSSIFFSRINYFNSKCKPASINIDDFKNLEEKQKFVNNTSTDKNLSKALDQFHNSVVCNYQERDNGGLDILSLMHGFINDGNTIKKSFSIIGESDTTTIHYNNHLFLFTDGYLEFNRTAGNPKFFFGVDEIENVRNYCKANNIKPTEALKKNLTLRIEPLSCEKNKMIHLYILETYDRGLNETKGTLKNSGDLSDNAILEAVWRQWANESGFLSFTWKRLTKPSTLPQDFIKTMITR